MIKNAPKIAAIDVGTNSFHLIIVSVDHRGIMQVFYKEKEVVRLGCCAGDMKELQEDAIQRGIDALNRFALLAHSESAEICAVATSAVREAANKEDFVQRVNKETGISIEVVSGIEEGRLIYLGAIHALPIENQKVLIIDIGGGSTETIIGFKGEVKYIHSEKLGAIRINQQFFPDGNISDESINSCRDYIKGSWAPTMKRLIEIGFETVIGTSGTIINLVIMALLARNETLPEELNGNSVSREELLNIIGEIISYKTSEERKLIPGLDPTRADIIVGGALIIENAIKSLNIQSITISSYALREGIVFNTIQKNIALLEQHQLSNLRYQTIYNIGERYNFFLEHSEHVKNLSLEIFDGLKLIHKLGYKEREWLEAAALLHDVGFYISKDQHHKHSYYLISHCDMPGFTKDESEIIANIARYHRKSFPKKKHLNFNKLNKEKKNTVKILAGILRIAEGIDRRQLKVVKNIKVAHSNKDISITLIPNSKDIFPDIELWGANRRKSLLEEIFNIDINFSVENSSNS